MFDKFKKYTNYQSLSAFLALNGDLVTSSSQKRYLTNDTGSQSGTFLANYEEAYIVSGNTYYVDPQATGANDGTSPTDAYTSLSTADNRTYAPNDFLLLKAGETHFGSFSFSTSGTEGNPISLGAYGSTALDKPIVDYMHTASLTWTNQGSNIWTSQNPHGDYYVVNRLWEDDIELKRAYSEDYTQDIGDEFRFFSDNTTLTLYSTVDPSAKEYKVQGKYNVLDMANNSYVDMYDIKTIGGSFRTKNSFYITANRCELGANAKIGVSTDGDTFETRSHGITFNNCIIDSNWKAGDMNNAFKGTLSDTRGCEDGIHISHNSTDIILNNCLIKDWGHSQINIYADGSDLIDNVQILNSIIIVNDSISYGKGLDTNGNSTNIKFHYNHLYNVPVQNQINTSNTSFQFNIIEKQRSCWVRSATPYNNGHGVHISAKPETQGTIIANNIFKYCEGSAIHMYAQSGSSSDIIDGISIFNNIAVDCGNGREWGGQQTPNIAPFYQESPAGSSDIRNVAYFNNLANANTDGVVARYWNVDYTDIASFESAVLARGTDTAVDNIFGTPTFQANSKYQLTDTSLGRGVGATPNLTVGFNGETLTTPYDIGAYEYKDNTISIDPSDVLMTTGTALLFDGATECPTPAKYVDGDSYTILGYIGSDFTVSLQKATGSYYGGHGFGTSSTGVHGSYRADVQTSGGAKSITFELLEPIGEELNCIALEVKSGEFINLYLNGVLVNTLELLITDTTSNMNREHDIGSGSSGSNYYTGNIGSMAYFKEAIGQSAISDFYNLKEKAIYRDVKGNLVSDSDLIDLNNLIAYYPINEVTGAVFTNVVDDSTVNILTASWANNLNSGLQKIYLNDDMTLSNTMNFSNITQTLADAPLQNYSIKAIGSDETVYVYTNDGFIQKVYTNDVETSSTDISGEITASAIETLFGETEYKSITLYHGLLK